ncbi:MAG: hypothetical protein ABIK37_01700 [candidate division WOR-3 bacterium]
MAAIAAEGGTRVFLVGGPVRDMLLGLESPDIDIAVERGMPGFGRRVARRLGGRFVYHERFMTGTVLLEDGRHIDICQTRAESYPRPAMLPKVRPADIETDLGRRDFSINALALEVRLERTGRLLDPWGGERDLRARQVRVLHERSFVDDPTRIFRCIRFAIRLDFEIERRTLELLRQAVKERRPALLTPERILYELRLICAEPRAVRMVEALIREQVLETAWSWRPGSHFLDRFCRLAQAQVGPEGLYVFWLSDLPGIERFPIRKEELAAAQAIRGFGRVRPRLMRASRPSGVVGALSGIPGMALAVLQVVEPAAVAKRIGRFLEEWVQVRPAITGQDLREMGLKPGPEFRRVLEKVREAKLEGRVKTLDEELTLARRIAGKR